MDLGGFFKGKDGQSPVKSAANTPCAVPAMVVSVTKGATDAFSSFGRHVDVSIRRLGQKSIKDDGGHGIGFSHGFGVGLTAKPPVVHRFQSCIQQAIIKMMVKLGILPSFPFSQSMIPGSLQSSMRTITGISDSNLQTSVGNITRLVTKTTESVSQGTPSDASVGSRSEKVIKSFLQSPILKNEETQLNDVAEQLRSENNLLQMLLKHQQVIEQLMEENKKLRQILVEDLKVPPNKLYGSNENKIIPITPSADCIKCRKRGRKSPAS